MCEGKRERGCEGVEKGSGKGGWVCDMDVFGTFGGTEKGRVRFPYPLPLRKGLSADCLSLALSVFCEDGHPFVGSGA